MSVKFRKYNIDLQNAEGEALFNDDYYSLRNFLIKLDSSTYHFGRWDWMITHGYLDPTGLPHIGLWEDNGEIVAAATYDCGLGTAFLLMLPEYQYLGEEVLLYAKSALAKDGKFKAVINDDDSKMQDIAVRNGFRATESKENDAVYPIPSNLNDIKYSLPEGFTTTSMADTYDLYKYGEVLWKGFDHETNGEGPFNFKPEDLPKWKIGFERPNCNLNLKIAVAAPNGNFVSYCGMWYDKTSQSALVEPVATDPAYRKMGLGKAAVLEGVRRCGELGAKCAFVGSSQQFYYSIGFRPCATSSMWE